MKTLLLIFSALVLSSTAFSQSYLGKSKEEIRKIAESTYDEVELLSETTGSFKLLCDEEVNEFIIADNVCVKFNSVKSYKCDCLATDVKTYNENLKSIGSLKWISKEGDKTYEILLNNKDYIVSISNSTGETLTALKN